MTTASTYIWCPAHPNGPCSICLPVCLLPRPLYVARCGKEPKGNEKAPRSSSSCPSSTLPAPCGLMTDPRWNKDLRLEASQAGSPKCQMELVIMPIGKPQSARNPESLQTMGSQIFLPGNFQLSKGAFPSFLHKRAWPQASCYELAPLFKSIRFGMEDVSPALSLQLYASILRHRAKDQLQSPGKF